MSLDSILRATGKNLANCGEKSDWYSPISVLTNLTVSDGVVSLPAVSAGSGMAINKNRVFTNGETFTIHANHTSPTGDIPANQYRYILKPYKNNTVVKDITITGWTYNQYYNAYWASGTSKSFTLPKDTVNSFEWGLGFLAYGDISAGTVITYSNIQIEKGSTATTYEPYEYLGPKSIYLGDNKNLFDINNVYSPLNTDTYEISDNRLKVYRNRTSVVGVIYRIPLPVGTQYTLYYDIEYGGTATGIYNCADSKIFNGSLNKVNYTGTVGDTGYLKLEFSRIGGENDKLGWVIYSNIQVELGSTATSYTPYKSEVLKLSYNSRNLLPYPYFHSSMTNQAGIAYTVNSDGTVTANGTATGRSEFVLSANKANWMSGNYTLSGCPAGGSKDTYSIITVNEFSDVGSGITIPQSELTRISIIIKQGTTVDNLVFKPQLELGDKATEYVPYFNTVVWTKKA